MSKYEEKFTVEKNGHWLSSWEQVAKKQILRFLNDDEFRDYISKEVLKNDENPPGPFTRFLYWLLKSIITPHPAPSQDMPMHEWRDELLELSEKEV